MIHIRVSKIDLQMGDTYDLEDPAFNDPCLQNSWRFPFLINPAIRKCVSPNSQSVRTKLFGCIFILNLNDYTQRKAWLRAFETKEILFLQKWLRSGDTAVDVGANVGLLTIPMAKAIGEKGQVYAFKPIELNVRSLKSNLDVNNLRNVELTQCAVGNFDGKIRLTDNHHSNDSSSGFFHRATDSESGIEVEQIRLDRHFKNILRSGNEIRLLKIDVEGMEIDVLDGLGDLFDCEKISAVMFEIFVTADGVEESSEQVIRKISDSGYSIRLVSRRGNLQKNTLQVGNLRTRRATAINLVAVSDSINFSSVLFN
jgi:FkbM family methyltransferase